MADTTKTTYTNATALKAAYELATASGDMALAEKLSRMHATAIKPRKKSNTLTKEQIQTQNMVKEAVAKMCESDQDTFTTAWIMANVQYVTSPQKASAIMKKAIEAGAVVRGELVKGRMTYMLAD